MAILGYLAIAFKAWMVVDALRRRAPLLWYPVLMLPFGDWIYFFAVKLPDLGVRRSAPAAAPAPPPSIRPQEPPRQRELARLEHAAEESPSFHNRVELAWALLDEHQPQRAQTYFELGLRSHPDDKEALYGLGLCKLDQDDAAGAIETLGPLVERGLAYEDYEAAIALAEALFRDEQPDTAVALLQDVTRSSHRLAHLVTLARYQMRGQRHDDARATLSRALEDFEGQPDFLRRRNGAVATEARQLLRALGES
ncbi:MAG: tetratricopeptide repeat protein [Myxococcales bacterium]